MRAGGSDPSTEAASRRLCVVPEAAPTLVLVGSTDPGLVEKLDALSTAAASSLDVRTGVLWTQVPDGSGFLEHLLDKITHRRSEIRFAFAAPDATVEALVRRALLAPSLDDLAIAVEQARLRAMPPTYEVRYQPVVSLADRSVIGFESLIRAHASGERIDAEELIARALRGGWIDELDQLGRTMALRGVGPWLGEGLLFLNMMAPDGTFDMAAIRSTIDDATEAGLDPDQIVLEAVERNRYDDLLHAAEQISELRSLGARIAVDDVGDGFASLRVVSAFKPDVVKIAGHLVSGLPSVEAEAIITAIVRLAHESGAWVVAENIETSAQAEQLLRLGVDWGQGLFLGAPADRKDVAGRTDATETGRRPMVSRT